MTVRPNIRSLVATTLVLTAVLAAESNAQVSPVDSSRLARQRLMPRIGFFFGAGLVYHQSDFAGIPEAPTCLLCDSGRFSGGLGGGIFGGALLLEFPIDDVWRIQAHTGYFSVGARQTVRRQIGPVALSGEDTTSGVSEYLLDTPFELVGGGVLVGMRPWDIPLNVRFGPEVGYLAARNFSQQEELVAPSAGVFVNERGERAQIRNEFTGEMEQPALQIGALLELDYELPLNRRETMILAPMLSYTFPLTGVRSDLDWRIHQARGGIALKYSLPVPDLPPEPKMPLPPPPPVREPVLAAAMQAYSVAHGREVDGLRLTIEEFVSTRMHSVLPFVFFEEGSSELPDRYARLDAGQAENYQLARLHNKSTLDVYYQTLNTIGYRMRRNPKARLTLIGTNSDRGDEAGNVALSRGRAQTIKDYLVDVWSIDADRIATSGRNLPVNASNPDDPDGMAENRRVEIVSTLPEILEPVTTTDTLRTVDPPLLRVKSQLRADAGIDTWQLDLEQDGALLKAFKGSGSPPQSLDWNMTADDGAAPKGSAPIMATLQVKDGRGKTTQARDTVNVTWISVNRKREERLGDTIFHRYNMITFDFNRANLTPGTMRIVDLIRGETAENARVEVAGYTDRVGDAAHNLDLSRLRAQNTARALGVPLDQAIGLGESVERFDNDLPEGRFLSRSVDVTVKTPINGE